MQHLNDTFNYFYAPHFGVNWILMDPSCSHHSGARGNTVKVECDLVFSGKLVWAFARTQVLPIVWKLCGCHPHQATRFTHFHSSTNARPHPRVSLPGAGPGVPVSSPPEERETLHDLEPSVVAHNFLAAHRIRSCFRSATFVSFSQMFGLWLSRNPVFGEENLENLSSSILFTYEKNDMNMNMRVCYVCVREHSMHASVVWWSSRKIGCGFQIALYLVVTLFASCI